MSLIRTAGPSPPRSANASTNARGACSTPLQVFEGTATSAKLAPHPVSRFNDHSETRPSPVVPSADLPIGVQVALEHPLVGYDSFRWVEERRPAFLKLGRETTAGIEDDAARRALLGALVPFADERGCRVVASGVETAAERDALRESGVHLGQGFFLGLPAPAGVLERSAPGPAEVGVGAVTAACPTPGRGRPGTSSGGHDQVS